MQRVSQKRFYNFVHWIAQLLLKRLFKFEVSGGENIPKSGPVIIMSNHLSYLDPIFIGVSIDREMNYMAKSTLFFPVMGELLRHMNAYPVKRGAPDRAALKKTLSLLKEGKTILIFPEGTRGMGDKLGEAKGGVGFVVYHSDVMVVPAFIKGAQNVWRRGKWFPRRAKVTLSFGKAIDLGNLRNSEPTRELYNEIGKRIIKQIGDLGSSS